MAEETQQVRRNRHGGHFLIPAGALIGLGAGMLLNQTGAGVLTGLGLGFVGSALYSSTTTGGVATGRVHGSGWIPAIVGVFLILIGLAIVLGPTLPWTTIIAVLIILFGLGFIARGFGRMG